MATAVTEQWYRNKLYIRGGADKNFCSDPPLFGSTSTISRFGEHFRDGHYSLISFLFAVLLLAVPPPRAQPYVKVWGTCPRVLWSRRHCYWKLLIFYSTVYHDIRQLRIQCASTKCVALDQFWRYFVHRRVRDHARAQAAVASVNAKLQQPCNWQPF